MLRFNPAESHPFRLRTVARAVIRARRLLLVLYGTIKLRSLRSDPDALDVNPALDDIAATGPPYAVSLANPCYVINCFI